MDMSKKEFIYNLIYENEKEQVFLGSKDFYSKMGRKYKIIPDSDLYIKIVNFQINKYGTTLGYEDREHNAEELRRVAKCRYVCKIQARKRKRKTKLY